MKTLKKISFFLPNFNIGGVEKSFIKMANHFEKKDLKLKYVLLKMMEIYQQKYLIKFQKTI